ncbi:protein of unknown function DUF178 [Hydrogenobaculum sp. Y04AAS1]|uniref:MqnA/MqnD/SBP family protein n=1 Tax=Hydrogenobaculum sp. (strain Y04AAS1) TaxID=380749 RepID=UPI00015BD2C8|nr:protein of unknown function DUF178 [Hydrogenobaculum sp. Y04AAS1]HCT67221.1 ABC transporter substrate-binding protein [Hydrogenobaculum sp.]
MIKVGKVSYLNTLPMFYNLLNYEIIEGHPSELFKMLEEDKIDIGILSSAVYLKDKDKYTYLDGVSISGKKMVCSVLLFLKEDYVKNVYLTKDSVTSRILTRWYVEEILKLKPNYVDDEEKADTILYIGDKAIKEYCSNAYKKIVDLGEEWFKRYGVGFVFALFTYKKRSVKSFDKLKEDVINSINFFYEKLKNNSLENEIFKKYDFVDIDFFRKYFLECLDLGLREGHKRSLEIFEGFVKRFGLT